MRLPCLSWALVGCMFVAAASVQASAQALSVTVMNGQSGFIADSSLSPFVIGQVPVVGGFSPVGALMPPPPPRFYADPNDDSYYQVDRLSETRRLMVRRTRAMETLDEWNQRARALDLPAKSPTFLAEVPQPPAPTARATPSASVASKPESASSAARAVPGIAEARRLHELEEQANNDEAQVLLERGISAEENGKPNLAKIYYKMAAKRASGDVRQQALARIGALDARR